MIPYPRFPIAILILTFLLPGSLLLKAQPFIDPKTYHLKEILPPPPQPGTAQYKMDVSFLEDAQAARTRRQFDLGMTASHDSVFDYAETLGPWFNSQDLPITAALFEKVTKETKEAIQIAKNTFDRTRPLAWKQTGDPEKSDGFSYPSGHTTRAFVWEKLLVSAFPELKNELEQEARRKAWYRVVLGRHFPEDVYAGHLYGDFLAKRFLASTTFLKQWEPAVEEMRRVQAANTHPISGSTP